MTVRWLRFPFAQSFERRGLSAPTPGCCGVACVTFHLLMLPNQLLPEDLSRLVHRWFTTTLSSAALCRTALLHSTVRTTHHVY
jgi:hypothetical protein